MNNDDKLSPDLRRDEKFHIENPRLFMFVIDIVCALLIAVALFFGIRYILNEMFKIRYSNRIYSEKYEESLLKLNIPESYLPYYNLGNMEYKNGEYDKAIADYKRALELAPSHSHEKECDIRVNLALAMLAKIDWNGATTQKDGQRIIRQLKAARNVLTEEGCANPDDPDGHNAEAEQLKADIDKMLEELQQNSDSSDSDENDDQQEGNNNQEEQEEPQESEREREIQDALDEQKKNSMRERQQTQENIDNQQGGPDNSFQGKTW